jgi:hypothetical protein
MLSARRRYEKILICDLLKGRRDSYLDLGGGEFMPKK